MARQDALLRLHRCLLAQRDDLRRKLSEAAPRLTADAGGDAGDVAQLDLERELESQLASLESRELARIEKAITAIQNGTYGDCDRCGGRIPVARLQALPYTDTCVECQRRFECHAELSNDTQNWESAWEFQARENDRELTARDVQFEAD